MTTLNVRSNKKTQAVAPATASEQLVAQAAAEVVIDTPNGLKITLRKPGVLSQFRLAKMLGEAAKNSVYVSMLLPITYISAINGNPQNPANSEREIEALITRLDDDGVNAVMAGVMENFGSPDPDAEKAAIKN